jgi:hypothetical protein
VLNLSENEINKRSIKMAKKKVFSEVLICLLALAFASSLVFAGHDIPKEKRTILNEAMENIQEKSAVLILDRDITGKILLYDWKDSLVVKLSKAYGKRIELLLEEGEYRIVYIMEEDVYESEILLHRGERLELNTKELLTPELEDTIPPVEKPSEEQRMTILRGKSTYRFYAEFGAKTTSMYGETGVLMGGNFGFTINRVFSFGVAGYGKANFDPGLPAYGGITFAYAFSPQREVHFKVTALAGSGTGRCGDIFYIFEPGIEMVLNLSRVVRIQLGLSIPLVDKEYSGLDSPMLCMGFQFGK